MMSMIFCDTVHKVCGSVIVGATLPRDIPKKYFDFFFLYFH
jgi:hypothetical protein